MRPTWSTQPYVGDGGREISFPLGGLGTGSVGLAGNGRLIDWEIANKPHKGSLNGLSHFAVNAMRAGKVVDARILQGDLGEGLQGGFVRETFFEGFGFGPRRENLAGMPHFEKCAFRGEFPFAEIAFGDTAFPADLRLFAFNPFIPGNEKDSGLPAAFFEISITNQAGEALDFTVAGALSNPAGQGRSRNVVERVDGRTMLRATSIEAAPGVGHEEIFLATDAEEVSFQEYFYRGAWCDDLQVYWNEFTGSDRFKNRSYPPGGTNGVWTKRDSGVLAAHIRLEHGQVGRIRFLLSWHYPSVKNDWDADAENRAQQAGLKNQWKNWYATEWPNAQAVCRYAFDHWMRMLEETVWFHDALYRSTLPPVVLEAVSANLAVLKSPTVWRLEDGTFYGWEGVSVSAGSCEGSCTHVWNYAQALPFLFPKLERSMRTANYQYNVDDAGGSHFRLRLPLGLRHDRNSFRPCADGQFGDVIKTYRDWKISGDTEWLRSLWPSLKQTVAFAWSPENRDRWDPERTGVLWGRQHHTLDMELFGPNSWLTGFYLAALKACGEMSECLGDASFAEECRGLFDRGKAWTDENLFNGEYYGQKLDLGDHALLEAFDLGENETGIVAGGAAEVYWNEEAREIKYQLGEGCGIDAVVAQWHANLCTLGEIFDPLKTKHTLEAIYLNNFSSTSRDMANPWRIFRLNDEAGTTMSAWPRGRHRPSIPLPYAQESMTGFEYAFAALLVQSGMIDQGLACVEAVRERYDGRKRNPWNEMECGSNYARAMASYSLLNAFSGFEFDLVRGRLGFRPQTTNECFRCIWAIDGAWGEVEYVEKTIFLSVLKGRLQLNEFRVLRTVSRVLINDILVSAWEMRDDLCAFSRALTLNASDRLALYLTSG
ncbi:non-lysosomal glucosylceramidase [soil metagenome]